jgi:hypothetical protein
VNIEHPMGADRQLSIRSIRASLSSDVLFSFLALRKVTHA